MTVKGRCKRFSTAWKRFCEGFGFPLLVLLCVGVVTGTAVWTNREDASFASVTPPVSEDRSASVLLQESLWSVTPTPLPAPTIAAKSAFIAPLNEMVILRSFAPEVMTQSPVTGLWSVHTGVDLAAEAGTPVRSMANGKVIDCGENAIDGCWLSAAYPDGVIVRYAGMALLNAIQPGDVLHAGQTIGFVGSGPLDEQNLGTHLHLSAERDDMRVDPAALLNGT